MFLALNGVELQHSQEELSDIILQTAAGVDIELTYVRGRVCFMGLLRPGEEIKKCIEYTTVNIEKFLAATICADAYTHMACFFTTDRL